MAWNPPSVQTGDRLPKILCPLIIQPPSTRSAVELDNSSGRSLPASPWRAHSTSPAAARSSTKRHESSPARRRSAATPVQYTCMLRASAVAGAW